MIDPTGLINIGRNFGRAFLTTEPVPEPEPVREPQTWARQAPVDVWGPHPDALEQPPIYGPRSARHERTRAAVERTLAVTR